MTLMPSDAEARRVALTPDRSFCVQAPAGSGKTELLTQRLLKLLSVCEQPEEILAITFTRKAAGEMRQRLLDSLQQANSEDAAGDAALSPHKRHTRQLARDALAQDSRQNWNLLQNPERLRLCTIDSFTSYLTARLPFTANFGARPELTTDMTAILQQAARATLQSLDEDSATGTAVATLLQHLHNNLRRAETLLVELLQRRSDWWPVLMPLRGNLDMARVQLERNLHSLLQELLEGVTQQLRPFQHRLMPLLQYAGENLAAQDIDSLDALSRAVGLPPAQAQALLAWQQLGCFLLTNAGEFRSAKGLRETHGFPPLGKIRDPELKQRAQKMKEEFASLTADMREAGVLSACQTLQCLPPLCYEDQSWSVVDAILRLLPELWEQLQVAMRAAGKIDHTETSLAALMALGSDEDPTDLALRLDYRLRHILVDEFQDTSHIQFRLLEKLTAGWQHGDGRTLFIVGDGMQSCYGFRNADVSLFLRARDNGIGEIRLAPLQLSVNFRSNAAIVEWVNGVFSQAFPADDDVVRGGVKYSFSEASRAANDEASGVNCRLLLKPARDNDADEDNSPDKASLRRDEAEAVANLCAELQSKHPQDHIAILVRGRAHLNDVVVALRDKQIAWNASEIDPLLSYTVIADLFTLLRALLNLGDITAWLALLRSPLVGLGLADLELLAREAKQQSHTLWRVVQNHAALPLSADAELRLQRCAPSLQRARDSRRQLPLRSLLEMTWIELGGPASISDAAMLPNVAAFFALVEQQAEQQDILDIHDFEQRLRKSHGSAQAQDVKLEIMTIHKSKGLEFDHVILCGLDRKPKNDDPPLLRWRDFPDANANPRLLVGLTHKRGEEQDALYRFLKQEEDARQDYETTRLLYIAVTRAAKSAWLFGTITEGKTADAAPRAEPKSLLNAVLPILLENRERFGVTLAVPSAPLTASITASFPAQKLQRLPADWRSPLSSPLLDAVPQQEGELLDEYDNLASRTVGTLIHFGLKLLVEQGAAALERSLAMPWWKLQLATLYADPAMQDSMLAELRQRLTLATSSPDAQWLFGRHHERDACELELVDFRELTPRRYVVDRTFVADDGTRWIVDYKTAVPATSQSRQAFLTEQEARYRGQLESYASLLGAMESQRLPCKLALYFTGLGLLHELG